jgi:hypothetical protein
MSSFGSSFRGGDDDDSPYVTGSGSYSGGACIDQPILKSVGCVFQGIGETVLGVMMPKPTTGSQEEEKRWFMGCALGVFIVMILLFLTLNFMGLTHVAFLPFNRTTSAFYQDPGSLQFATGRTDRFQNAMASDDDWYARKTSHFINSREQPYFSDVTNRVLGMENREKEAVRALGKINQERLRRAASDTNSTTPLPWEPFWKEWQSTHAVDGDEGGDEEGFSNEFTKGFSSAI